MLYSNQKLIFKAVQSILSLARKIQVDSLLLLKLKEAMKFHIKNKQMFFTLILNTCIKTMIQIKNSQLHKIPQFKVY